jgi:hypothetical protein
MMVGVPGGGEWLVIVAVAVLLFVPSVAVFFLGYAMGRRSAAAVPGATVPAVTPGPTPEVPEETRKDGEADA